MAKRGFVQTPEQLKMVTRILDGSGRKEKLCKNNLPGKSWWYGFVGRHPDIKTALQKNFNLQELLRAGLRKSGNGSKSMKSVSANLGLRNPHRYI